MCADRKKDMAIRGSNEWFTCIFDGSLDAIFIADRHARFVEVNRAAEKLTGYTREELLSLSVPDLHDPQDREAYKQYFQRILDGESITSSAFLRRKDGRKLFVEFNNRRVIIGDTLFMHTVARDITDRMKAEEALRQSEERFRLAFQTSPDSININRLSDGMYVDVNEGFTALTGYSREEVIGRTSRDINIWVKQEDRNQLIKGLHRDGVVRNMEALFRLKNGTMATGLISARLIPLHGVLHIISITRNIEDRKQAEREKAALEEQLLQVQKIESIGRLAGGVAHDFNNLLSAIIGYGELSQMEIDPDNPVRSHIQQILDAAGRAKELTGKLLAFSRKQILQMETLDLNRVILDFESILRRLIREDIEMELRLGSDIGLITGDVAQIQQVVMNLAVNSRDAMPDGGRIVIETEALTAADAGFTTDPGRYSVILSISDTGQGMDPETLEHAFEPFFTTKKTGAGTGLGLATVYGIVKQHGGDIRIVSQPGKGTHIRIIFPRVKGVLRPTPSISTSHTPDGGHETILVVEDELVVRRLVVQVLSRQGYRVLEAEDVDDARRLMDTHRSEIDLLVTDMIMPRLNGKELYEQFKRRLPHLKVLFMSGYSNGIIGHNFVPPPDGAFIHKPFTIIDFSLKVRELLDR